MTLSYDDFYAWLESHEPDAVVGHAREGNHCPIATWTGRTFGGISEPQLWHRSFAGRFARAVDAGSKFMAPITAHDALLTLMEVGE